ncbi:MAG: glycosyltransferase [Thermoplasmata archaeon]
MISVICVCNDEDILRANLLRSLSNQDLEYEFIKVDNTSGEYTSAATGLNEGAAKAMGDLLMFAHQDIVLGGSDFLRKVSSLMSVLPRVGIAGVAGRFDRKGVLTNITHGDPPVPAGHIRIDKPEPVQTVDECLFVIPRTVFEQLKFDDGVCDDWHLYAVDYSLSVKRLGFEAYVLPLEAHHQSKGKSMTKRYYRTLSRVARKHAREHPWIHTSLGSWRTRIPISLQLLSIRTKRRLRGEGGRNGG